LFNHELLTYQDSSVILYSIYITVFNTHTLSYLKCSYTVTWYIYKQMDTLLY